MNNDLGSPTDGGRISVMIQKFEDANPDLRAMTPNLLADKEAVEAGPGD